MTAPNVRALSPARTAACDFVTFLPHVPEMLGAHIGHDGIHVTVPNVPALREWAGLLTDPAGTGPQVRGWLGATVVTVEVQ